MVVIVLQTESFLAPLPAPLRSGLVKDDIDIDEKYVLAAEALSLTSLDNKILMKSSASENVPKLLVLPCCACET